MTKFLQVALRGVVGPSYQGDVAVDDVILTDGTCENRTETSGEQLGMLAVLYYCFVISCGPT